MGLSLEALKWMKSALNLFFLKAVYSSFINLLLQYIHAFVYTHTYIQIIYAHIRNENKVHDNIDKKMYNKC